MKRRCRVSTHLEDGERVEADDGYPGEIVILRPKKDSKTPQDIEHRQRVRNRHETVNSRLKDWKCLAVRLKHDLQKHSAMFRAVAVICQVSLVNGEPLFEVDYDQDNFSMYLQQH
mmetsp:Transcript_17197/g.47090  ORF Transcript_17197/g.47090 Transcript_17197/m.47090 type:complete len:115 (-) Transcript_17197:53-397(-)